jgi:hypothetical protein
MTFGRPPSGRDEGDVLQPAVLERGDLTLTLRHT